MRTRARVRDDHLAGVTTFQVARRVLLTQCYHKRDDEEKNTLEGIRGVKEPTGSTHSTKLRRG